jgi:hypothetical protein
MRLLSRDESRDRPVKDYWTLCIPPVYFDVGDVELLLAGLKHGPKESSTLPRLAVHVLSPW